MITMQRPPTTTWNARGRPALTSSQRARSSGVHSVCAFATRVVRHRRSLRNLAHVLRAQQVWLASWTRIQPATLRKRPASWGISSTSTTLEGKRDFFLSLTLSLPGPKNQDLRLGTLWLLLYFPTSLFF